MAWWNSSKFRVIPGSSPASFPRNCPRRRATAIRCSRASAPRPAAVLGIHPGGEGVSGGATARPRNGMKLGAFDVGPDRPFFLISGPCVIESEAMVIDVAGRLRDMTTTLGIPFIFKASFDKANRSSKASFRGPGIDAGLKALDRVRKEIGVPVLTDVHEDTPLGDVAAV